MHSQSTAATFSKSQVASLCATIVEYCTILLWTEVFHQFYVIGVALGAITGATTNFLINRHWSFQAADVPAGPQVWRYILVSIGSLILNTGCVYLITENFHIFYMFSVMGVGLMVGFFYNYPLQRYFVYKKSANEIVNATAQPDAN
jgi:putative flippase GtrA